MKFVCPYCDAEERPVRLRYRITRRRVRCCRVCRGVLPTPKDA